MCLSTSFYFPPSLLLTPTFTVILSVICMTSSLPVSRSPGGTSLVAVTGIASLWSQQSLPSASFIQSQIPIWGCGLGVDHGRVLALYHALRGSVTLVGQAAATAAAAQRHGLHLGCFAFWFPATGCGASHRVEPSWERIEIHWLLSVPMFISATSTSNSKGFLWPKFVCGETSGMNWLALGYA